MARNRHNIGFMALDTIAIRHGFSPWRPRFKGLLAEGMVGGEKVLGLKPQTYMNASGESVQAACARSSSCRSTITAFMTSSTWCRARVGDGETGRRGGGT